MNRIDRPDLITATPLDRYIRQSQLIPAIVPFSAPTLWRKVANGTFPKPVKLSAGVTAWRVRDVEKWLEDRAQGAACA